MTFNERSTPKHQPPRLHVPLNFSGATSGIAADRFVPLHTRPTMEYVSTSWDPYKIEDVIFLDKVQRRAVTITLIGSQDVSQQSLAQLQDRLKVHRKCMLFKPNYMPVHESFGTYRICHGPCASGEFRQNLFGSHTQSIDVDEDQIKF